ncbi:MAG: hypothetical protein ACF8NJ_07280 [Phycisphaerales bacterium JB038]
MTDASHRPVQGQEPVPRTYGVRFAFHPHIKLTKKAGLEFATRISDYLEPKKLDLDAHQWTLAQPVGSDPNGSLATQVTANSLSIETAFPTNAQEWFEQRFVHIIEAFADQFKPALVLEHGAIVRATVPIEGDARVFLLKSVLHMAGEQMRPLKRPIHLVGLRLFFPPFEQTTGEHTEQTDWDIELKAESLLSDPSKLFLEVDATRATPQEWKKETPEAVVELLGEVKDYLGKHVIPFLESGLGSEEQ